MSRQRSRQSGDATGPSTVRDQLHAYPRSWLSGDIAAAVTVWAIVVPQSIAYATVAGMPPQAGLYTATLPLLAYALLGSSRRVTVGPSAAVAALSAATVAPFAAAGSDDFVTLSVLLAMVVGVVLLLAGIARLGVIAEFLSAPVLKGFIVGVALTIALGQSAKLIGLEVEGTGFFTEAWDLVRQLSDLHGPTLAVGLGCLVLLFLLERVSPRVPGALVVVVLSILAVGTFDLTAAGVAVAGEIPSGLPLPDLPTVELRVLAGLVPGAVGVAVVVYGQSTALVKTSSARHGEPVDADRELVALGAANVLGGLFGGFTAQAAKSRTAAADAAGQRTQVSSLVVVALLVVTLLFLTGLFTDLPEAALAAIILHAILGLVRLGPIASLRGRHTVDFWAAVMTLFGVLVLDVFAGLMVGVTVSLAGLMARAVRPRISWLGRDPATGHLGELGTAGVQPVEDVAIVLVGSELFFANVGTLRDAVIEEVETSEPRAVVLDAGAVSSIDTTAADLLVTLVGELADRDVAFLVSRLGPSARAALVAGGLELGGRAFGRTDEAVSALGVPRWAGGSRPDTAQEPT